MQINSLELSVTINIVTIYKSLLSWFMHAVAMADAEHAVSEGSSKPLETIMASVFLSGTKLKLIPDVEQTY